MAHAEMTRRGFALGAGGALGAAAVTGLGVATARAEGGASKLPDAWDYETDVAVVGFGGAGAVAAITAADEGAKVLLIEKQRQDTDEQVFQTPSTRLSRSACMSFNDEQGAIDFLTTASRGATPDDVIAAWAPYAVGTNEWLEDIGGVMNDFSATNSSEYPYEVFPEGQNYIPYCHEGFGEGLWATLTDAVYERDIDLLFNAPAQRLITNDEGAVVGVTVLENGEEKTVKARKGVILACGGFEFDFDMLKKYLWANPCRFIANPGNTGDGLRMATDVGAALWHTSIIGGWPVAFIDELGVGYTGNFYKPDVWVDKYGNRFCGGPQANNNYTPGTIPGHMASYACFYWDFEKCDFPAVPFFSVFDQSVIDSGPVLASSVFDLTGEYTWSSDNSAEIEKGWIYKGETFEELAGAIEAQDPDAAGKMDAATLAQTLTTFNQYCADGVDPEYGVVARGLTPLATPPFYAVKLYPGCFNTFGGPQRDPRGRIVNDYGEVIPGLYGAGELGSIMGFLYAGGGWNICEAVTSGRIAGESAAASEAWDA